MVKMPFFLYRSIVAAGILPGMVIGSVSRMPTIIDFNAYWITNM